MPRAGPSIPPRAISREKKLTRRRCDQLVIRPQVPEEALLQGVFEEVDGTVILDEFLHELGELVIIGRVEMAQGRQREVDQGQLDDADPGFADRAVDRLPGREWQVQFLPQEFELPGVG
jgi:hypothetical protein